MFIVPYLYCLQFPEIMTDDDYEDAFNFLMESFCTRITKSFDKLSVSCKLL